MWWPNNTVTPVTWKSVSDMFSPFAGSCLYAIRADAFFHLAQANSAPAKFAAKNCFYPVVTWARAARAKAEFESGLGGTSRYLFVCDYAAEPGLGTLRPVLQRFEQESLFVALDSVMRARAAELLN